ncbi:hypothetical protein OUZ56_009695 [Daphnia magna]|uniref:Uncharacterized protein n=1 Tax=Daphnia magna TaxID=35525 RepID=A0ABR0AGQ2_9CRUS|nr:hypothetical protein OUZ56_009695 [Daphnia magna]
MRANEDSGLETTLERRSVRKGPLIQRFVRSVRERFTPLRSGGGSTSILRNNENLGVELDSDSPHQSDIGLLDSNEIKELRNDDQWNEVLNMQVSSQDETVVEPLIGEETRELLSYNQLLEQARAITDLEKTTDRVENTEDISLDFQNLELRPLRVTIYRIKDYKVGKSPLLQRRSLSSQTKSRKINLQKKTNQDMPIKIYVKELSRLMESGMDYEDASKAADCIVQHVLTNTKRCINSSQKTKPNGQPVFRTSSQPSYLTSTPLHTQPLALSGQSVKIPSMYNKQSNNGATPKYSVTSSIPKMNPLVMCPSKVNSIGNTNNFISNAIDKNKKLQQSQAMTLFSNVGIYVDRERSGRFDDWLAHLESVLVLGDFEESRKIILLRSKLYGEAADEFDNFKLENPISAQIYDRVKERLIKLFHSTETRSKQSVEFHNMQREPEENMRR